MTADYPVRPDSIPYVAPTDVVSHWMGYGRGALFSVSPPYLEHRPSVINFNMDMESTAYAEELKKKKH